MTVLDAVVTVLRQADGPLHYREITRRALDDGHWATTGQTPADTVNARLAVDIKKKGDASRFVRVRPGVFGLAELAPAPVGPAPARPASTPTLSFTDATELVLDRHADRQPMHYREITERVLADGLVQTHGKTPEATLYAQVLNEIKRVGKRGEVPRFVKHGRGYVGLRKWMGRGLAFQIERHNAEIRKKLLVQLRKVKPEAFEALVGRLLVALGFEDVVVTHVSADGGIDVRGTLVVGDVVRTQMAVQAKRWKKGSNVRRPTVQQVRGSLGVHEQGLIITTSGFSPGAIEDAAKPNATPIGLMDGGRFVELLVEHGIGVTREPQMLLELADLDTSFEDAEG